MVNELESHWSLVSISSYSSSVSSWSGQRCSSNKRKRATLMWDPSHVMGSCRLHAFVDKVRRSWGRSKWPVGLGMRPEVCVYVYKTGLSGWPSHNQQTPCLLPFVYPLALQSWQNFNEFYSPGCYQNDGGVSDYPKDPIPMDSLFCESILCWGSLCFPFAELELFIASLKKKRQNKVRELVHEFKSHVNNEMCKVLVAYVHLQAEFKACTTKVFLVITLNVWDMPCLDFNTEEYFC